jgi:hypothetical protein
LGLIGAVEYRKAYKYMAWKKWPTTGEPEEPNFQEPELLGSALQALGTKVDLTLEGLRRELHFTSETFKEVTGFSVPAESDSPQPIRFPG